MNFCCLEEVAMKAARVLSFIGLIVYFGQILVTIFVIVPLISGVSTSDRFSEFMSAKSNIKSFEESFTSSELLYNNEYKKLKSDYRENILGVIGFIILFIIMIIGSLLKIKSKYLFIIMLIFGILSLIRFNIAVIPYIIAAILYKKDGKEIDKTATT
jgi:hypothetical protein